MTWVAFDRAIRDIEKYGLRGPLARWRKLRARIHADICRNGFDRTRKTFVQYYGATEVDASLLLIPQVGFLPPDDPRVKGTIAAIERDLVVDGLVMRYRTLPSLERTAAGGRPLSRLLVLARRRVVPLRPQGRCVEALRAPARAVQRRRPAGGRVRPRTQTRMLGNFPQALSHMALINTARNLSQPGGPAEHRSKLGSKVRGQVEPWSVLHVDVLYRPATSTTGMDRESMR